MYLKMVKGDTDFVYVKLYTKFQELVNRDSGPDKTNSYGISYIESFPILEFEKDKIQISLSAAKMVINDMPCSNWEKRIRLHQ